MNPSMVPSPLSPSTDTKTVLIVDDNHGNLSLLGQILMPHYNIRAATSGARALIVASTPPVPDVILLDNMMPEMDGYTVLKHLKENDSTKDIPVIFVTALNSTEDETGGLKLGAVDYITKPFRPAILLARVRTHIELKEARGRMSHENLWLESEVARRMQQNQTIQDVALRALASIAEARDQETGAHLVRTQGYIKVLAEALSRDSRYSSILTPAIIDTFTKAAPLHDLGKVGIPDSILHKTGKHTPEEWEIMKSHSRLGADAIWRAIRDEKDQSALDFLHVAMDIAHYHHERWDGGGYPNGLAGEQIPLSARLMAVADVFDALITERIYKPSFTFEQAQTIITEGKGKHFDPDIVDAFQSHAEEFRQIAMRHNKAIILARKA